MGSSPFLLPKHPPRRAGWASSTHRLIWEEGEEEEEEEEEEAGSTRCSIRLAEAGEEEEEGEGRDE